MYQLFYVDQNEMGEKSAADDGWGSKGKDARMLSRLRRLLARTSASDQHLLLHMAQQMSKKKGARSKA
jgi:hypothetical protein